MIGVPPQDGCRADRGIDLERRGLLRLAAGATAAVIALPPRCIAAGADAVDRLDASIIGDSGTLPRLGYRRPPSLQVFRRALGTPLRLSLKNNLSEATGLDWHGLRASNGSDFVPGLLGAPVMPGAETTIELKPRDSGTLWFHPPFVPGWSDQTARGLAGMLIVEEPGPSPADDDVPLLIAERLDAAADGLSVNGGPGPVTRNFAPGSRLRLRLVNGSTRLALLARIVGARPMIIAIDGQPSELFRPIGDTVPIGPGSRFDLLIDLPRSAGSVVRLLLRGLDAAAGAMDAPIFVVRAEGVPAPERPPIAALSPNPALPRLIPLEKATRANILVRSTGEPPKGPPVFTINGSGRIDLPKAPLFVARRNAAVTLGLTNGTAVLVGFRPHGQALRLLHSLDDGWEPYWRDSILVPPGKTLHAAFVADTPGRWLIESPFFDQATSGLRHWFEIT